MNMTENSADFRLWTPWGPQFTSRANSEVSALRSALRRSKSANNQIDKIDRQDRRLDKPECAYEP